MANSHAEERVIVCGKEEPLIMSVLRLSVDMSDGCK